MKFTRGMRPKNPFKLEVQMKIRNWRVLPSQRIHNIVPEGLSDGWGVFMKAREMIAQGHAVIELTIGEHDIKTAPDILRAMQRSAQDGHTGYAPVPGTQGLRKIVAAHHQAQSQVSTSAENVLITPGAQAALFAAHLAACNPHDKALYIDPYYTTYPGMLRALSLNPIAIATKASEEFQPNAASLNAAARGATSLLINSPNNPTGVVYSQETLAIIADTCRKHDLWLISDEVYASQIWSGQHITPRSLPGMKERSLIVGSMSKSHAMTGSRIGWVIGPEDIIAKLSDLATVSNYGVVGFIQDAAEYALKLGSSACISVAAPFERRRKLALEILKDFPQINITPPQGTMYLMLDIRSTGLNGEAFANALLEERKIAVMPGESFGAAAAGHIRVAMTVEDALFSKALTDLCDFASALASK